MILFFICITLLFTLFNLLFKAFLLFQSKGDNGPHNEYTTLSIFAIYPVQSGNEQAEGQ